MISTHVLRMEDDNEDVDIDALYQDFNPRPSHGGRHVSALAAAFNRSFQSTSCAWRTTMSSVQAMTFRIISIRVLRMEDDIYPRHVQYQYYRFQSTSCAWRTTRKRERRMKRRRHFNPRPAHGGRLVKYTPKAETFQPASLMRGDDNNRTKSNEA